MKGDDHLVRRDRALVAALRCVQKFPRVEVRQDE